MRQSFIFNRGELAEGLRFFAGDIDIIMAELSPDVQRSSIVLQLLDCEVGGALKNLAPKKIIDLTWLVKPGDVFSVVPCFKEADTGWLFVNQIGGIVILPIPIQESVSG